MTTIVWITGRAATGKSTLVTEIGARLRNARRTVHRLCDEDLLFELKTADTAHEHHWHPNGDPTRFPLRSGHLFDQGLRVINTRLGGLLDDDTDAIAVVELARGRSEPIDVSYRRAMDLVDQHVWDRSVVFRLELPFTVQAERNQHRQAMGGRATPHGTLYDLYRDDDPETFSAAGIPVTHLAADADPATNTAVVLSTVGLTP